MRADVYEPAFEESIGSRKDGGFLPWFDFSWQVKPTIRHDESRRDDSHRRDGQLVCISRGCLPLPPLRNEPHDQCDHEQCPAHDRSAEKSWPWPDMTWFVFARGKPGAARIGCCAHIYIERDAFRLQEWPQRGRLMEDFLSVLPWRRRLPADARG